MVLRIFPFTVFPVLLLFSCQPRVDDPLEAALLQENWEEAFSLAQQDTLSSLPRTAGIIGHSAMMCNKNNLSYRMFDRLSFDSVAQDEWLSWTELFVNHYPEKAVAQYFYGDAQLRKGNIEKALECFTASLQSNPRFAPAFNARGMLYALKKDRVNATADLNKACVLDSSVAAFFANRGTFFYNFRTPEAAWADFKRALAIAPDFAVALNGMACSMLFSTRNDNLGIHEIDSISNLLDNASHYLRHVTFEGNARALLINLENNSTLILSDSCLFRLSDFTDWDSLYRRSKLDSTNLFTILLNGPLPATINAEIIGRLNMLLSTRNLFKPYLSARAVPDSLKEKISQFEKEAAAGQEKSFVKKTEYINRIVIEKFYHGLIADHQHRNPGMNITTSRGQSLIDFGQNLNKDIDKTPRMLADDIGIPKTNFSVGGAIREVGKLAGNLATGTGAIIDIIDAKRSIAQSNVQIENNINRIKEVNPAMYNKWSNDGTFDRWRGTTDKPGGALADVRRVSIDSGKPYFMSCVNGMAYVAQ